VGSETLTIYWLHLLIIYGSAWNIGLVRRFGRSLNLLEAFVVFVPMFLTLVLLVVVKDKVLRWWRTRRPSPAAAD
jgi:surface polysaccharide O-acyltransferase-like enzyme